VPPARFFRAVYAVQLKDIRCQIDSNADKPHGGLLLSKPVLWKLWFGTNVPSGGEGVHPIALGRKQPMPVPAGGVTTVVRPVTKWVATIRYAYGSVAAIQRKIVAAISKIWWAQLGAVITFVTSISESHSVYAGKQLGTREKIKKPLPLRAVVFC
jgi:hypothetical protein